MACHYTVHGGAAWQNLFLSHDKNFASSRAPTKGELLSPPPNLKLLLARRSHPPHVQRTYHTPKLLGESVESSPGACRHRPLGFTDESGSLSTSTRPASQQAYTLRYRSFPCTKTEAEVRSMVDVLTTHISRRSPVPASVYAYTCYQQLLN